MAVAGVGFIGYAILFLIRNYTHSFLELGIGVNEVSVTKDQIRLMGREVPGKLLMG